MAIILKVYGIVCESEAEFIDSHEQLPPDPNPARAASPPQPEPHKDPGV